MLLSIQDRKGNLDKKASRLSEPKFLIIKPTPKNTDGFDTRDNCRIFNRSVENVIKKYDNFYCFNDDEIKPDEIANFDSSENSCAKGMKKLWAALNTVVMKIDNGKYRPFKVISQSINNFRDQNPRRYDYRRFNKDKRRK